MSQSAHIAATTFGPHTERERVLCERASRTDYWYIASTAAAVAATIVVDGVWIAPRVESPVLRMIGPGLIGSAWGAFLGGSYLALPKCSPGWANWAPPDGDIRSVMPLAIAIALAAGATAPILVGIEQGNTLTENWSTTERQMRLIVAGVSGFGGALLPYVLSPLPWRAAKELRQLQVAPTLGGVAFGYFTAF